MKTFYPKVVAMGLNKLHILMNENLDNKLYKEKHASQLQVWTEVNSPSRVDETIDRAVQLLALGEKWLNKD